MSRLARPIILHGLTGVGGIACAVIAASILQGRALPFSRLPSLDGYTVEHTPRITVYAAATSAARDGHDEVDAARKRFQYHFDMRAPALVVVLADEPAAFARLDLESLRPRNTALLPFVTRAHLDSQAATGQLVLDQGAVLREIGGAVQVVGVMKVGPNSTHVRAGDVVVALNGVRADGLEDLTTQFHAIAAGDTIRLDLLRARKAVSFTYLKRNADALAEHAYRAGWRPMTQSSPLAHEACHLYVAALAERASAEFGASRVGDNYGHPHLPDWMDEAAATLCETPQGRLQRRNHFRANLKKRIPLRDFVRMHHPSRSNVHVAENALTQRYDVRIANDQNTRRKALENRTILFYSQALSLGEFIRERGGPKVLQLLVRSLASGRTLEHALAESRQSAPDFPVTIDELESEWIRWVDRESAS